MRFWMHLLISFQLIFAFPAYPVEVTVGTAVNLRKRDANSTDQMTFYKTIPAGTVLEIPDDYIQRKDDKTIDWQGTLNNWLQHASITQKSNLPNLDEFENDFIAQSQNKSVLANKTYENNFGKKTTGDFFQVKIVSVPKNDPNYFALKDLKGGAAYVSLDNVGIIGNLKENTMHQLKVTKFTPMIVTPAGIQSKTESEVCIDCKMYDATTDPKLKKLYDDLAPALKRASNGSKHDLKNKPLDAVIRNFNNSCQGLKFDKFSKYLDALCKKQNIPTEVMLGIMTQESAGNCFRPGDNSSASSASLGLFQITPVGGLRACRNNELTQIKNAGGSIDTLKIGPSCLENPIYNTQQSINVLKQKYRTLFHKTLSMSSNKVSQLSSTEKDQIRLAVAAYNGGEGYVMKAQSDMATVAQQYGIKNFNPNKWEDLRLFYFRKVLEKNSMYGVGYSKLDERSESRMVINVKYVDSIVGREVGDYKPESFASRWEDELKTLGLRN